MDNNTEDFFDNYFETVNLNSELESFYEFLNNDDLNNSLIESKELTDLRNENYKRYNDINLFNINTLSPEYQELVNVINKIYNYIIYDNILKENKEEATNTKKIIDLIYSHIDKLESILNKNISELEEQNDIRQNKLKQINYSAIDKNILSEFLTKYNNLVLFNSTIEEELYKNYKRQLKRKKYLNELYRIINLELEEMIDIATPLEEINKKINEETKIIYNKIYYLEDLLIEGSKYQEELIIFKNYFSSIIAYNDSSYLEANRVYDILCNNLKIKSLLDYFEASLIKENEDNRKEENFIYEKYGIKNIKSSLDYISANYIDVLNEKEKSIIDLMYNKITDECNLKEIYAEFKKIISKIWNDSLTNIYSYNEEEDFCFICTNNQFLDEKHESILITKEMLNRVTDYLNYQIGFICDYNDNILYITENEDIMSVNHEDMSNLKSPKQIEQEFINFKVCNRLALNGYITKIKAVYLINDGNMSKYKKAVELANQYKLPLIVLKKDN